MTSLATAASRVSAPAWTPRQLARGRAALADREAPARPLRAGAPDGPAIGPRRLEAGHPRHRASGAPCLGLALAAGGAFWVGFGGALTLLLG
jgi:hypothetical protein